MASVIFLFLSLIVLIRKHDCAAFSRMDQQRRMKEIGFQSIVKKIMNPLRKLTAELPNHNIEMEIEIVDPVPSSKPTATASVPRRRIIHILKRNNLKKIARSMNGLETTASSTDLTSKATTIEPSSPPSPLQTELTTKMATTTITTGNLSASSMDLTTEVTTIKPSSVPQPSGTELTTTMATTTITTGNISEKIPIYMEDLKKAMNDLEKRLSQKSSSINTSTATPRELKENIVSLDQSPSNNTLESIMNLLQKAVYVKSNTQPPNNSNLDWVQLKIPKGII